MPNCSRNRVAICVAVSESPPISKKRSEGESRSTPEGLSNVDDLDLRTRGDRITTAEKAIWSGFIDRALAAGSLQDQFNRAHVKNAPERFGSEAFQTLPRKSTWHAKVDHRGVQRPFSQRQIDPCSAATTQWRITGRLR